MIRLLLRHDRMKTYTRMENARSHALEIPWELIIYSGILEHMLQRQGVEDIEPRLLLRLSSHTIWDGTR